MCINENIFKFNELGLLPPGCHEVTLIDIKTFFVDNFPESKTRQSRFDCFIIFYKDLLKNVKYVCFKKMQLNFDRGRIYGL